MDFQSAINQFEQALFVLVATFALSMFGYGLQRAGSYIQHLHHSDLALMFVRAAQQALPDAVDTVTTQAISSLVARTGIKPETATSYVNEALQIVKTTDLAPVLLSTTTQTPDSATVTTVATN